MIRRNEQNLSDVAQTLHEIIKESPGIHFRSLGREAGLSSVGQLRHHLDSLRRQGAIVELEDGRFKRFFAAGAHDPRLRDGLSRFARRVPRRIARLLLSRSMNRTEIRRNLNCADSTLGYHLNRMVEKGDLKRSRGRNCCIYSLTDPDFVRELLQQHPAPTRGRGPSGSGGPLHEPTRPAPPRPRLGVGLSRKPLEGPPEPSPAPGAGARSGVRERDPNSNPNPNPNPNSDPDPDPESDPVPTQVPTEPSKRPLSANVQEARPDRPRRTIGIRKTKPEKPESEENRAPKSRDDASEVPRWLLSG